MVILAKTLTDCYWYSFENRRQWSVILVRTVIDGDLNKDAHGRSF